MLPSMKQFLLFLLLAGSPLASATGSGDAARPLLPAEQKEVLAAGSALIGARVELRGDGTAHTTHRIGKFSARIELVGLAFSRITRSPLNERDRQRGIARRYIASVTCESHRIWDEPLSSWSPWKQDNYGFFPSTIIVEEIRGKLVPRATRISDFSPGLGELAATP